MHVLMFTAALLAIIRCWKRSNCPSLLKTQTPVVLPYDGILWKHATTWTNLKNIMLTERGQTQKIPYYMIPLT